MYSLYCFVIYFFWKFDKIVAQPDIIYVRGELNGFYKIAGTKSYLYIIKITLYQNLDITACYIIIY